MRSGMLSGISIALEAVHAEKVDEMEMFSILLLFVMVAVGACALIYAERSAREARRSEVRVPIRIREHKPRR